MVDSSPEESFADIWTVCWIAQSFFFKSLLSIAEAFLRTKTRRVSFSNLLCVLTLHREAPLRSADVLQTGMLRYFNKLALLQMMSTMMQSGVQRHLVYSFSDQNVFPPRPKLTGQNLFAPCSKCLRIEFFPAPSTQKQTESQNYV